MYGYTGPGTTWANMKFSMNHAPGAGSIAQPQSRLSSAQDSLTVQNHGLKHHSFIHTFIQFTNSPSTPYSGFPGTHIRLLTLHIVR